MSPFFFRFPKAFLYNELNNNNKQGGTHMKKIFILTIAFLSMNVMADNISPLMTRKAIANFRGDFELLQGTSNCHDKLKVVHLEEDKIHEAEGLMIFKVDEDEHSLKRVFRIGVDKFESDKILKTEVTNKTFKVKLAFEKLPDGAFRYLQSLKDIDGTEIRNCIYRKLVK